MSGRGMKRAGWVSFLYTFLDEEFERLYDLGVKVSGIMLFDVAYSEFTQDYSHVSPTDTEPSKGIPYRDCITKSFIKRFREYSNIVRRRSCGNKERSPEFLEWTDRLISFHLGQLMIGFDYGTLNQDYVENMDETHFTFDMGDGYALAKRGENVKYKDVVFGSEGFTIVLRLSGGEHAWLMNTFIIFKDQSENYPIQGCPDVIDGCSYRTQRKGWMNRDVFLQWLQEPREIDSAPHNNIRHLYVDNSSGHAETVEANEALTAINTALKKLPPNGTEKAQAFDFFIIATFKKFWCAAWDEERNRWIDNHQFSTQSGKVEHCAQKVNELVDEHGVLLRRKSMKRTGLSLDLDGIWRVEQLYPHLRDIIADYPENFNGTYPAPLNA